MLISQNWKITLRCLSGGPIAGRVTPETLVPVIFNPSTTYSLAAAGPSAAQILRPKKKETGVTDSVKANLILGGVELNLAMALCASAIVVVKDRGLRLALHIFHFKRGKGIY